MAAALLFFSSVLAHELSHSLVARAYGIRVRRIVLFVFGGMAQIEHEPGRCLAELCRGIVGPITCLVIGFVCLFLGLVGIRHVDVGRFARVEHALACLVRARSLLMWLGQINIILALFNLVASFQVDGGRVLRAILCGVTEDLRRATRWASSLPQAFAWLLIGAGIAMVLGFSVPLLGGGMINGIWLAFIGWFLKNPGLVSYRQLLTHEILQVVSVARIMLTRFETVPPDLPLDPLVGAYMQRSHQHAYPVVAANDEFIGMVFQEEIDRLSPVQRRTLTVRDVLLPPEKMVGLGPQVDVLEVLNVLANRDLNHVSVLEQGQMVGLVHRADILRWVAVHARPSAAKPART